MVMSDFDLRRDAVFEGIVNTYIETGMPVGSVALCNRFNLDLSPATIRNIMRELELMGYITQPHTSAGRVPTDAGYRYYIDSIMRPDHISNKQKDEISSLFRSLGSQPEMLVEKSAKILSEIVSQASIALFPKLRKNSLCQIKLVSLGAGRALAVLITNSGLIKSIEFACDEKMGGLYLEKIANAINNNCANKPLDSIKDFLEAVVLSAGDFSYYIYKDALDILEKTSLLKDNDKLFIEGAHYLYQQLELKDALSSRRLFSALDEKQGLLNFIEGAIMTSFNGIKNIGRMKISIGGENSFLDMQDCSIVVSAYGQEGNALGAIGIIGPRRMQYSHIVPLVKYIAGRISEVL